MLSIPSLPEGLQVVQIELPGSDYRALPTEFLIGSWKAGDPLFIVTLSSLMMRQDPSSLSPLSAPSTPPAHPYAAEFLRGVDKKFHLIYTTQNSPLSYEKQKKWLETFAFPKAPLIQIRKEKNGLSKQIKGWKDDGWKHLQWLVTHSQEEAQQSERAGIRSIHLILNEDKKTGAQNTPLQYLRASDWKEIGEIIKKK